MSSSEEDASPSPEPGTEQESGNMGEGRTDRASTEKSPSGSSNKVTKANAKDPSRPRRKKARRACFACQRAHLTCGDERPCNRCVKRNLADQCQDGVRKKAKYLHDAPDGALVPGFAGNYNVNGSHSVPGSASIGPNGLSVSQGGTFYPPNASGAYPQYSPLGQQGRIGPPLIDEANMVGNFTTDSPTNFHSNSSQQVSPVQNMATMDQSTTLGSAGNNSFDNTFFDPNDSSSFNFNLSDYNFGNHYGALEFGMLGHMSSGAVNTPDLDVMNSIGQGNQGSVSFDGTNFPPGYGYGQGFHPWQNVPNNGSRQASTANVWSLHNNGMDAFAVGEHTNSLTGASPHSQSQDFNAGYSSSTVSPEVSFAHPDQNQQQDLFRQTISQPTAHIRKSAFPTDITQAGSKKRRRDTAEIYASVQKPYPYTQGFHGLTAFLQRRYSSRKVLRIAKALASFRPSFIACNKNLNNDDLIFMEKCFQRTLMEYEDFMNHVGTPTLILRRTGEIAGVNKEFSLVTGWRRDVLLGNEANLNINTGENNSGTQTGTSSKGTVTPRMPATAIDSSRPHPVFVAEVLDEDSVVQFYEDFAELAFGASRSSIIGAGCSMIKYKTKDHPGWGPEDRNTDEKQAKTKGDRKTEPLLKGQDGMNALGEKDGRVEAVMSWTVKRDVFDIPMMIVMNFLPVI